jgi:hypothetical protein
MAAHKQLDRRQRDRDGSAKRDWLMDDTVEQGREAWRRLHDRERATWSDWLTVGNALVLGRAAAMAAAKSNTPMGTKYNRLMGEWLRANGFDGISNQERYRCILCVEHADSIEEWRQSLPEAKRRKLNHPGAVWHAWRKATQPSATSAKIRRRIAAGLAATKSGKPVYWSQDHVRRAHLALLRARSSDLLTLARAALQGAIRNEHDLLDLLEPPAKPAPASQDVEHGDQNPPSARRVTFEMKEAAN